MKKVTSLTVKFQGNNVGTLSLAPDGRRCAFEYDKAWLADGFSISPLELPLRPDVFVAQPTPFNGAFGIFEDSLPDGYGRYLMHKALRQIGIDDFCLSALDRLSIIGNAGMGGLTYEPQTTIAAEPYTQTTMDLDLLQEKALEVLREQQDTDAGLLLFNSANSGGCRPKALFTDKDGHWLVKFRHTYDPLDIGQQEYHYNETARRCGINVPDFKLLNGKYFACRRFDIDNANQRHHVATAGALLSVPLDRPVLDYLNLLALTGYITQSPQDVEEMFRRMVFNYLMDNKDDHCKNFSFIVEPTSGGGWRWRLAPAYDLTRCTEGYNGQHATSVNNTSTPTVADMITVGTKNKITERRCREIYDEVRQRLAQ